MQSHEALGIRATRKLHSIDDALSAMVGGPLDSPEPYDGVDELWYGSLEAIAAAGAPEPGVRRRGAARRRAHVPRPRPSPLFLGEEHPVIDG